MSDIAAKVLSDDDVPCGTMTLVELLLDLSSDIFLDVVFLESCRCDIDGLLLQLLAHVDVLNGSLGADAVVL